MLYDMMIDEFKKNFKPTFREEGLVTICFLGQDAIVKKNETDQSYTFLKEYPPEIKVFILEQLKIILKPKYFLATYDVMSGEIKKNTGEVVNASLVSHSNHLLTILRFLEVPTMSGLLVRQLDEGYEFRPVIEEVDNGYNLTLKNQEVLKFLQVHYSMLLPKELRLTPDEPKSGKKD
jgi:hypothetical protein